MAPDDTTTASDALRSAWRDASLVPLWESPTAHKPDTGPDPVQLWAWETVKPLVLSATEVRSPAAVERRVLSLVNRHPRHPEDEATVGNLAVALQILMPGEAARPHRHSMNALRFMLEGHGAVTVVDGKACVMEPGDLVLTPGWCWHEHHYEGEGPAIWLDVLDVPLHQFLGTAAFQPGPIGDMPSTVPDAAFSAPNIVPVGVDPDTPHAPVFRYPWSDAVAAVASAPIGSDGVRRVRYANPLTGGSAMSLIDCFLVEVDRDRPTQPTQRMVNSVFLVVDGEGATRVGEEEIRWAAKDIFVVPRENVVSHKSQSAKSHIFEVTDGEVYRRLGLPASQRADAGR